MGFMTKCNIKTLININAKAFQYIPSASTKPKFPQLFYYFILQEFVLVSLVMFDERCQRTSIISST